MALCVGKGPDINLRAPTLNTPLFSGEIMALCVGGGPDIIEHWKIFQQKKNLRSVSPWPYKIIIRCHSFGRDYSILKIFHPPFPLDGTHSFTGEMRSTLPPSNIILCAYPPRFPHFTVQISERLTHLRFP